MYFSAFFRFFVSSSFVPIYLVRNLTNGRVKHCRRLHNVTLRKCRHISYYNVNFIHMTQLLSAEVLGNTFVLHICATLSFHSAVCITGRSFIWEIYSSAALRWLLSTLFNFTSYSMARQVCTISSMPPLVHSPLH